MKVGLNRVYEMVLVVRPVYRHLYPFPSLCYNNLSHTSYRFPIALSFLALIQILENPQSPSTQAEDHDSSGKTETSGKTGFETAGGSG